MISRQNIDFVCVGSAIEHFEGLFWFSDNLFMECDINYDI